MWANTWKFLAELKKTYLWSYVSLWWAEAPARQHFNNDYTAFGKVPYTRVAFMVPGHPLTASTADRPSGWVLWTTGTDVAAKLLAKTRSKCLALEQIPDFLWFFFLLYLISDNGEKLVTSEKVQETLGKQAIATKSQLLNWHKAASVTRLTTREKASENAWDFGNWAGQSIISILS